MNKENLNPRKNSVNKNSTVKENGKRYKINVKGLVAVVTISALAVVGTAGIANNLYEDYKDAQTVEQTYQEENSKFGKLDQIMDSHIERWGNTDQDWGYNHAAIVNDIINTDEFANDKEIGEYDNLTAQALFGLYKTVTYNQLENTEKFYNSFKIALQNKLQDKYIETQISKYDTFQDYLKSQNYLNEDGTISQDYEKDMVDELQIESRRGK